MSTYSKEHHSSIEERMRKVLDVLVVGGSTAQATFAPTTSDLVTTDFQIFFSSAITICYYCTLWLALRFAIMDLSMITKL